MKGKNNKGITLIALIVTIIVLVIIAGISISSLTSDNGILRQVNTAKVEQIEATAREQVKLAVSALRLAIAEAGARDNSYKANENAGKIQAKLKELLNYDITGLNGEFDFGGNELGENASGTEIKINYTGDDYKNACNDTNAEIVYEITLGQRTIELTDETNATLKDQNQNNADIDVGGNEEDSGSTPVTPPAQEKLEAPTVVVTEDTLTVTAVANATSYEVFVNGTSAQTITNLTFDLTNLNLAAGTYEITVKAKADGYTDSDLSTTVSYTVEDITTGAYLVDTVEIGDYVDIGIDYTNGMTFESGYTTTTTALTGWRVLSKSGEGATGIITLVSAGTPLRFYHSSRNNAQTAIDTYFDNLNTEITIVASDNSADGFTGNGFSSNDLASIWASNSRINASTAHAMTITELETAYEAITGTAKTVSELYSMTQPLKTSKMTFKNTTLEEKAKDLLGIGMYYWLGGSSFSTDGLWIVSYDGYVTFSYDSTLGVRPAVSLNSGVKIAGDNTGTGADVSTAYKLAE